MLHAKCQLSCFILTSETKYNSQHIDSLCAKAFIRRCNLQFKVLLCYASYTITLQMKMIINVNIICIYCAVFIHHAQTLDNGTKWGTMIESEPRGAAVSHQTENYFEWKDEVGYVDWLWSHFVDCCLPLFQCAEQSCKPTPTHILS